MPFRKFAIIICLGLITSGCFGITTSLLDIEVDQIANPDSGPVVTIASVSDKRRFRVLEYGEGTGKTIGLALLIGPHVVVPEHGGVPSVETFEDFNNPSIRARTIGRAYGGYGNPLGSIILPKTNTVSRIVRGILESGLRESGYRVVASNSPESVQAIKLKAEVLNYWSWSEGAVIFRHFARVKLVGDWPVDANNRIIQSSARVAEYFLPTKSFWNDLYMAGNDSLTADLKSVLRK